MQRARGRLWRTDPRPGALVILAGVALLAFLTLVFAVIVSPAFVAFDTAASEFFRDITVVFMEPFFRLITRVGNISTMVALTVVAVFVLLTRGKKVEAVLFGLTMALGTGLGFVAKLLVERARPGFEYARIALPDSYSFPSGHALSTFLFFALIAFIVSLEAHSLRTRAIVFTLCIAIPALVGASRVYLGVHWFGDVIASWALGVGIMSVAAALYFNYTPDPESH